MAPDEDVRILGPPPRYVSRGGLKLEAALDRFGVDPAGRRALDAGSSTGGFTDCLLQRGASAVTCVDVGTHQLHERLRADPRVEVREQTDIRSLTAQDLGGAVDLAVGDLSFISLRRVLPALTALLVPGADLIVLVKPQFEAGRTEAARGRGVVRDAEVWRRVLGEVADSAGACGTAILGAMTSPITGTTGNVEFLVHGRHGVAGPEPAVTAERLDAAVAEARRAR